MMMIIITMPMKMKVIGCIEWVGIRWLCQASVEIKGLAKTALILILIIAILIIFLLLLLLIIIIIVIVIIIFIIIISIAENPVTITYILSVTSIYNLRCYVFFPANKSKLTQLTSLSSYLSSIWVFQWTVSASTNLLIESFVLHSSKLDFVIRGKCKWEFIFSNLGLSGTMQWLLE